MRLGFVLGYSGAQVTLPIDLVLEAERLGFDSVWTAEAYGSDAVSTIAWVGALTSRIRLGTAIMQMPARTPAMTAMTAMTIDQLSGGRFILGIGPSGPQVVEGWHGVSYGKPLQRTREYISIVRRILAREQPLEFSGREYQVPYKGVDASGLGKPLKSIIHGRAALPIYTASINPKAVALSAEIADGLIPVWMNPERFDLFAPHLEEGFRRAGGSKDRANFEFAPFVTCVMGDDLDACRAPIKANLALYIGGMGARDKNFYKQYTARLGYEAQVQKIQDLFLAGQRNEAQAAVPDKLVDEIALVGTRDHIANRIAAWKASPIKTMLIGTRQPEALRLLAELCL
ncbi:MAG: LLM class F420-dependent oxidoreductase [Candidatus Binataceae bacterium]|nr:LLM class F420-dependent oxidoreductase [Candidatus Binataceae bacterium]